MFFVRIAILCLVIFGVACGDATSTDDQAQPDAGETTPVTCALEEAMPCTGEDCCPAECEAHEGDVYDMDAACGLGTAVYGCTAPSPDIDDAPAWYCSADGEVAAYAPYQPSGVTDDEQVLRCTDLDEYDDDPTEAEDFPACD